MTQKNVTPSNPSMSTLQTRLEMEMVEPDGQRGSWNYDPDSVSGDALPQLSPMYHVLCRARLVAIQYMSGAVSDEAVPVPIIFMCCTG